MGVEGSGVGWYRYCLKTSSAFIRLAEPGIADPIAVRMCSMCLGPLRVLLWLPCEEDVPGAFRGKVMRSTEGPSRRPGDNLPRHVNYDGAIAS